MLKTFLYSALPLCIESVVLAKTTSCKGLGKVLTNAGTNIEAFSFPCYVRNEKIIHHAPSESLACVEMLYSPTINSSLAGS